MSLGFSPISGAPLSGLTIFSYTASGGLGLGNSAGQLLSFSYNASGGLKTGNAATSGLIFSYTPVGGLSLGNTVTVIQKARLLQSGGNSTAGGTTVTVTWGSTTTPGSLLVAVVSSTTVSSINTPTGWRIAAANTGVNPKSILFYQENAPATTSTVFSVVGAPVVIVVKVAEIANAALSSPIDSGVINSGSTNSAINFGAMPGVELSTSEIGIGGWANAAASTNISSVTAIPTETWTITPTVTAGTLSCGLIINLGNVTVAPQTLIGNYGPGASVNYSTELVFFKTYRFLSTTPSGGLTLTGTADASGGATSSYSYTASGGLSLGNSVSVSPTYLYTASGGITLNNNADVNLNFSYTASGKLSLGNSVGSPQISFNYLTSGGLSLGNSADVRPTYIYTPTGGLNLGNSADVRPTYRYTASGKISAGNTSNSQLIFNYAASGKLSFPRNTLADLLVSHWRMNEASGDAIDATGNYNLTLTGTLPSAPGKIDTSRSFPNDNGSYFQIGTGTSLDTGGTDYTIGGWVYFNSVAATQMIVAKADFLFGTTQEYYIYYFAGTGLITFVATGDEFTSGTIGGATFGTPPTGTWIHVLGTYSKDTGISEFWINGISQGTTFCGIGGSTDIQPLTFGIEYNGSSTPLNGRLDSWSFWRRQLSSGEIAQIYNSNQGLDYPLSVGNTSRSSLTLPYSPSGGLTFSGTAPATNSQASFSYTASGKLSLGNSADVKPTYIYNASGSLSLGNSADVRPAYIYIPTGGLNLGNSATVRPTYIYNASGGLNLGSNANIRLTFAYNASGGLTFSNTAVVRPTYIYTDTNTLQNGLTGYWKMDEPSGTTNANSVSASYTFSGTGTNGVPGKIGNASENISRSTGLPSLASGSWTFQSWLYPTSFQAFNHYLAANDADSGGIVLSGNSGGFSIIIYNSSGIAQTITAPITVSLNTWYLVHAWKDATTNTVGIAVNGGTATIATPVSINDAGTPTIGSDGASGWHWTGRIDECAYWTRAITAGERSSLYNSGSGLPYPLTYPFFGTISLGGSAVSNLTLFPSTSGGLSLGSSAIVRPTYNYNASGGLTFSGTAPASETDNNVFFSYTASGNLNLGGSAIVTPVYIYNSSGGLTTGGSATVTTTSTQTYLGSGGLSFSNSADVQVTYLYTASGKLNLGGVSDNQIAFNYQASGGLKLGGSATVSVTSTQTYVGTGGLNLGNSADVRVTYLYNASGGLSLASSVSRNITFNYSASGKLTFSNSADVTFQPTQPSIVASGTLALGSTATVRVTYIYQASGYLSFAGSFNGTTPKNQYSYEASGSITFSGELHRPFDIRQLPFTGYWDLIQDAMAKARETRTNCNDPISEEAFLGALKNDRVREMISLSVSWHVNCYLGNGVYDIEIDGRRMNVDSFLTISQIIIPPFVPPVNIAPAPESELKEFVTVNYLTKDFVISNLKNNSRVKKMLLAPDTKDWVAELIDGIVAITITTTSNQTVKISVNLEAQAVDTVVPATTTTVNIPSTSKNFSTGYTDLLPKEAILTLLGPTSFLRNVPINNWEVLGINGVKVDVKLNNGVIFSVPLR